MWMMGMNLYVSAVDVAGNVYHMTAHHNSGTGELTRFTTWINHYRVGDVDPVWSGGAVVG
jgi:hypothetical protein